MLGAAPAFRAAQAQKIAYRYLARRGAFITIRATLGRARAYAKCSAHARF